MNEPFPSFRAEFKRLATLANKTNSQKVEHLKSKISQELADTVTLNTFNKPAADDITGWYNLCQQCWDALLEKSHFDKIRASYPTTTSTPAEDPMILDAITVRG